MTPEALWAATGRGRKTADELLEAFEASGEANIASVCRMQRQSLVALFGEERYQDLLEQCEGSHTRRRERCRRGT